MTKRDIRFDFYHPHVGQYYYKCYGCGAYDWVGYSINSFSNTKPMRDCTCDEPLGEGEDL